MVRCPSALYHHLVDLSKYYRLSIDDYYRFVIIHDFNLPPGFNWRTTNVLVELPLDYPQTPPGVGDSRVFVRTGLRFYGHMLADYYESRVRPTYATPGFGPWAWVCYQHVRWNPLRDNLIRFLEMLRADLTNPPTI
jgi:hypothetical protein